MLCLSTCKMCCALLPSSKCDKADIYLWPCVSQFAVLTVVKHTNRKGCISYETTGTSRKQMAYFFHIQTSSNMDAIISPFLTTDCADSQCVYITKRQFLRGLKIWISFSCVKDNVLLTCYTHL